MAGQIDARLKELGITLPEPPAPRANYVGYVITGNLIFTAGQVPLRDGKLEFIGKLGRDMAVEQGYEAAKLCAVNVLAQVKAALGGRHGGPAVRHRGRGRGHLRVPLSAPAMA